MHILREFQKKISQYRGVQTEWVEGDIITHNGDRRTDLKISLPCVDGTDWGFTLQDETAAGIFLASRVHNSEHAHEVVDESLLQELASCYHKRINFVKKEEQDV